MIQQAEEGVAVQKADLSRAFLEMKYAAKTDNDNRALQILTFYRDAYITVDDTPASKKELADCRTAAEQIFMRGAGPDDAGKPCTDSLGARVDVMMKQRDEEDRKKNAGK